MTSFTDDQLQEIAQSISDISVAVGQVRLNAIHAGAALSDPPIVHLLALVLSLNNLASIFALQAANVTLDDVTAAVNTIKVATTAADKALATLATVDKAISIASAVIVLGTAVFTGDPGQIATAAKGVYDASTPAKPAGNEDAHASITPVA